MKTEVMFSILLPVYNQENHLALHINKILKQTYDNFEVIAIDDCSTDGSLAILNNISLKDSRLKVYKNSKNRGVGYTRNKLLSYAKGKYILFVDPDDYIEPKLLENIQKYTSCDYDIIRFQNVVEGATKNQKKLEKDKDPYRFCCPVEDDISSLDAIRKWDMGLIYINASLWTYAFKRSLFIDNKITFASLRLHEDYSVLAMLLLSAKKIKIIDYIGYHYLQYDSSLTKINEDDRKKIIKNLRYKSRAFNLETKRIIKFVKNKCLPLDFKKEFINDLKSRQDDQKKKYHAKLNDVRK